MQRILNISASNFMTFSDVHVAFDHDRCYIIKGENHDDAGQQSNGSGKTSLIDIIAVALLGESLTGRDLKDCVNWNGAETFFTVTVVLRRDHLESGELDTIITRKVYSNTRSSELSITINGKPIKGVPTKTGIENGVDVKAGNQYILDIILGLTKEDLLSYFLISGDYQSFFSCGNAKKIEIINRFSKAQIVDGAIDKLTNDVKLLKDSISSSTIEIAKLDGHIQGLKESISDSVVESFYEKKKRDIASLFTRIESLEENLSKIKIEDIKQTTDWPKAIAQVQAEIAEVREVTKKLLTDQRSNNKFKTELLAKLAGEIECPKCEHHFILDSEQTIDEMRLELSEIEIQLYTISEDIDGCNAILQELEKSEREVKINRDLEQDKIQQNRLKSNELSDLERQIAQLTDQLDQLDTLQFDDSETVQKIKGKQKQIDEAQLDLDMATGQSDLSAQWIEYFKKFKFYLANKPIEIICHYTNEFLRALDSELSITIEGFKILKSGEFRAELTPMVYRNGLNPKPYSSFSEGEKVRLNIAVDLALQRLVNENSSEGLQFYSSDELLNSLDSLGLLNAAKALNCLNQTICLISHSGNDLNYENVITVSKKNNITTVL